MGAFKGWQSTRKNKLFAGFPHLANILVPEAYTLRKLNGSILALSVRYLGLDPHQPCFKIRRSSDNTLTDIYFVGDNLDISSLLNFVGSGSGFVHTWYDQSPSANHAIQTTNANQPRLVNAGVLEIVNNHPAVYFDGANDYMFLTSPISSLTPLMNMTVSKRTTLGAKGFMCPSSDKGIFTAGLHGLWQYSDNNLYTACSTKYASVALPYIGQIFAGCELSGAASSIFVNGAISASQSINQTYPATFTQLGKRDTDFSLGWGQEALFFPFIESSYCKLAYEYQAAAFLD